MCFMSGKLKNRFSIQRMIIFDHSNLLFLQLCSASRLDVYNDGLWDNTHAIAIFDNLIFDANQNKPLSLSEENIDLCLTGGPEYVYHHVNKGYVFIQYDKKNI